MLKSSTIFTTSLGIHLKVGRDTCAPQQSVFFLIIELLNFARIIVRTSVGSLYSILQYLEHIIRTKVRTVTLAKFNNSMEF